MADNAESIQTFIFMDFEVAGKLLETEFAGDLQPRNAAKLDNTEYLKRLLLSDVDLCRVPRIAEMSFVFVPRAFFIESAENMHQKLLKHEREGCNGPLKIELPMDICTNQLNPDLSEEDWDLYESKQASIRLRRSELAEKNRFGEVWPAVHHLLKISQKPACLVAHNGLQFDFRILMHELSRTNMLDQCPIPEGVLFLDSYLSFVDIEAAHHRTIQQTLNSIDWNLLVASQSKPSTSASPNLAEDEQKLNREEEEEEMKEEKDEEEEEGDEDEIILIAADCALAENFPPSPSYSASSSVVATDEEEFKEKHKNGKENEKEVANENFKTKNEEGGEEIMVIGQKRGIVVDRRKMPMGCSGFRKRKRNSSDQLDPQHPFRFLRRNDWCPAKRRRVPANLFEIDKESGQWHFSEHASNRLLNNSGNFKLPNIFRSLIGTDFRAHRAQADAEALLQVSLAYGSDFIEIADKKSAKFPGK